MKAKAKPQTTANGATAARKRKTHKKSRLGCRNCKLRRVKCNETRPMCEQCQEFGVICNYDASIPDLQPHRAASSGVQLEFAIDKSPLVTTEPVLDMVNAALQDSDRFGPKWTPQLMQFDNADLARLEKFQTRTVLTIGVRKMARLFQRHLLHLACTHRFLMHLVQVVTASHDRYISRAATARPKAAEAYHMSQALASFQTILSRPIHPDDRDALMVAASLLGVVSFCTLEAANIENVWPLADSDMSWLTLSDGKKTVFKLATPWPKHSLWWEATGILRHYNQNEFDFPDHPNSVFDHLCSDPLDSPEAEANPYYRTSRALIPLIDKECNDSTWLVFLGFLCHVDPPFKLLLDNREPWALLILCYWFMKVCRGSWWVASRCILQGLAICLYLERHYPEDAAIQAAIIRPRAEFEAALKDGWGGMAPAVCRPLYGSKVNFKE